jgi:SAM-dependent methyltransferase
MIARLRYETLERLTPTQPVDRLGYIADQCRGKVVLDLGCLDETALLKRDTEHWLHGRIARVARQVIGVDSSSQIPETGIETAANARIRRGDAACLDPAIIDSAPFDIVVAGEFIEHIQDPLAFLIRLRASLPGRELVLSTPNGAAFANTLMGMIGREAQHPDHLANFSFKILNTLCLRAGLPEFELVPYRFFATEMILRSSGFKRGLARSAQSSIRIVERLFPLLSFGYIVKARL